MDEEYYPTFTCVENARSVMELYNEMLYWKQRALRAEEYEVKYNKLLDSTIVHNDVMAANILKMTLHFAEFPQSFGEES